MHEKKVSFSFIKPFSLTVDILLSIEKEGSFFEKKCTDW